MNDANLFTPDDLTLLARAAVLAGTVVAIARYSGRGTSNEFQAIITSLESAALQYPENPLVQALLSPEARADVTHFANQFQRDPKQTTYQELKFAALNRCSQAADLLAEKASPQAAAEVKHSILEMCRGVAQASRESGGGGGEQVDVKESGVLDEIARVLG